MRVDASSRSRGDNSSSTMKPTWRKNTDEREVGAAGVVDAGKAGVRDDVERLLAAIIGVRTPADIGEQARGVAQPALPPPSRRGR